MCQIMAHGISEPATEDEKENKNTVNRLQKTSSTKISSTIKKPAKKAVSTLKF